MGLPVDAETRWPCSQKSCQPADRKSINVSVKRVRIGEADLSDP